MKRFCILIVCLLLCLAACTKPAPAPQPTDAPAVEATETPAEPTKVPAEPTDAPAEPTDAPAAESNFVFSGTTLYGEPIDSGMFRDYDLVIVNCWAEWCGPCVGELAALEQIHQEYPNVLILGVLVATNSVEDAKATLESKGVTYPALEPVGDLVALSERSMYIPATYFFDKDGNETGEPIVGGQSYEEWKAAVDNLLG